jgi:ABC-type glycerol-3-phosphate transport system substrate-binding protein
MRHILVLIALTGLFACSSSKKSTENSNSEFEANAETTADSIYSLRVSFISIGSGTDRKARKEYEQFIIQFEESNKVTVLVEKANWGKEGEIDFCIKLTGLGNDMQKQFIQGTKDNLKDSKLVRIYENTSCKYKQ